VRSTPLYRASVDKRNVIKIQRGQGHVKQHLNFPKCYQLFKEKKHRIDKSLNYVVGSNLSQVSNHL
jgi:hypothetical protein